MASENAWFDKKALRNYGTSYDPVAEDPTRCVAKVSGDLWGWHQCSRPRGKGDGGLYCGTHARMGRIPRSPEPGSYLRAMLKVMERRHEIALGKYEVARSELERVNRDLSQMREVLPEVPDATS